MGKIILIILLSLLISGCAGVGFNKKATVMPDEFYIGGETNPNEEDSGKISFGFKWKFEKQEDK